MLLHLTESFHAFISVAFLMVLQLPGLILDWYKQFQLEEGFEFSNKSTLKLWVVTKIKENILGLLLGILLFALIIWLFRELSNFSSSGSSFLHRILSTATNLNGSLAEVYITFYLISSLLWMMEI